MGDLYQSIMKRAIDLEAETVRFLAEMIKTPSFSTKEGDVIELIRGEMQSAGFDEVRVDGLGNIIGRIGAGPRQIAFDAHVDTVYPGDLQQWSSDPFSGHVENGRICGRGAADQKGGMAAMVSAARIIKEMELNENLTILFTGTVMEEDCDGLCWNYLIDEEGLRPELVVITEPTNMRIHRGQRGRMEMKVAASGVSCHGSAPERGENAVYKMSRVVLEIERLNETLKEQPFLGKGTIAVTEFKSDAPSLCAVPDSAAIHLDRRLTTGETKESALAEVKAAAERAGCADAVATVPRYEERAYTGLCYPMEKYYPTWTLDEKSPHLVAARETFESLFDRQPEVDKWTFSTNGVTIAGHHGIPCIGFGPGEEPKAHTPNETCPIDQLSNAAAFYAAFVAHLNGKF